MYWLHQFTPAFVALDAGSGARLVKTSVRSMTALLDGKYIRELIYANVRGRKLLESISSG
jgi:hypothetical protein